MPQVVDKPKAFEIDTINRPEDYIGLTINSNLAITIANILANVPCNNKAVFAFAKQCQNAVMILDARKTCNDFDGFEDTEIIDNEE